MSAPASAPALTECVRFHRAWLRIHAQRQLAETDPARTEGITDAEREAYRETAGELLLQFFRASATDAGDLALKIRIAVDEEVWQRRAAREILGQITDEANELAHRVPERSA